MKYYIKTLRLHNCSCHSFWAYLDENSTSIQFQQESKFPLEKFLRKHFDDVIVSFDGEYLFGRYSQFVNTETLLGLDILYYLIKMQKFSIGNFLYTFRGRNESDDPYLDHRTVSPQDMTGDFPSKNYLQQYCSLTKSFMCGEDGSQFVTDFGLDAKLILFYQDIQPKICENVFMFNSTPLTFDMSSKSTKKLRRSYEEYITKIRRHGSRIYPNYYALSAVTGRLGFFEEFNPMVLPKEIRALIVPSNDLILSMDAKSAEPHMVFELSDAEFEYDDIYEGIMEAMGEEFVDRDRAKSLWFNFVYGSGSTKQSTDMQRMNRSFPEISSFIQKLVARSKKEILMYSYFGRRLPKIEGRDYKIVNHYIQSTFSDFFQLIVNRVSKKLKKQLLKSKVLCTIHDEFLIDAKEEELDLIIDMMQSSIVEECNRSGFDENVIRFEASVLRAT
jgi:hypothetical protein